MQILLDGNNSINDNCKKKVIQNKRGELHDEKLKQILAIIMISMMTVGFMPMVPGMNGVASADTAWTQIGESDCQYKIETSGDEVTLTIAPTNGTAGTLPSYDFTGWPWFQYSGETAGSITKVVIEGTVNGGEQLTGIFNNFKNCKTIDGLSNLKTTDVKKMNMMFLHCNSLETIDVSGFDTSKVTSMNDMFNDCSSLTELDVSNFSTNSVTNMTQMFQNCSKLTSLDLSNFNTGNVTTMESMFKDCSKLASLDLSNFNTGNVTDMSSMVFNCSALTSIDLSGFNTGKVKKIDGMFCKCGALTTIFASGDFNLTGIDEHSLEKMQMFMDCTSLKGGAGTTYDSNRVNATYARIDGGTAKPGYFTRKTVNIAKTVNGKLTVSNEGATTNEKVTVTATPDEGYELDKITIKNKGGQDITSAVLNGTTITMPTEDKLPITVSASFKKKADPIAKTAFIAQGKSYKKSVAYSWNAVEGAASYKVYQVKCGKKKYKKVKTTTGLSYTKKKLKRKTTYKAYVVAYNAAGQAIAQTPIIHNRTKGGSRSNATAVGAAANASIKVGATTNVGAAITAKDSKKKLLWKNHVSAPIRYYSADAAVATVDANGNVYGVAAGVANIYSVAPSGVCAVTKVSVQKAEEPKPEVEMVTVTFETSVQKATFANYDGKMTSGTNTMSVPKGCTVEYTGNSYYDKVVTFKSEGKIYTTVYARGNGSMISWKESNPTTITGNVTIELDGMN